MSSITFWTRLEPFTRLNDIGPGLEARTADPLWLLNRQNQVGEFLATDSGFPAKLTIQMERAPLARFYPGTIPAPEKGKISVSGISYQGNMPLEAVAEGEPIQLFHDSRRDLRLAAEAGLYFLQLLDRFLVPPGVKVSFIKAPEYRLAASSKDPAASQDQPGQSYLSVMTGRIPDGFLLYRAFKVSLQPSDDSKPGLPQHPVVPVAERKKVTQAALNYVAWFESQNNSLFSDTGTWNSERMEYSFAVSAASSSAELALEATEYPGGTLDWYSFNHNTALSLEVQPTDPQPEAIRFVCMPNPLHFPGMAADRWWEIEDGRVNFGRIGSDPDELMRMLLIQFALVYNNDWYIVPLDLGTGAIYTAKSVVVTDTFGERTLIQHYSALDKFPRDWRMFALSNTAVNAFSTISEAPDNLLFLPPVLASSLHGDPIEEVVFMRDELSNLVWAMEYMVPGISGTSLKRDDLYNQRISQIGVQPPSTTSNEELDYVLATSSPDYLIPFVKVSLDTPEGTITRLQRAAILSGSDNRTPTPSLPIGRLLENPNLSLLEEEVPRNGIRLIRQFQHARGRNGSGWLWLTRRKAPANEQSWIGLHYDQVQEGSS